MNVSESLRNDGGWVVDGAGGLGDAGKTVYLSGLLL